MSELTIIDLLSVVVVFCVVVLLITIGDGDE